MTATMTTAVGTPDPAHVYCPACGLPAVLVRQIDRFIHMDGSANTACWSALSHGGRLGRDHDWRTGHRLGSAGPGHGPWDD